jgi:hypothetical protein
MWPQPARDAAQRDRWLWAAAHASTRDLAAVIVTAMTVAEEYGKAPPTALEDVMRILKRHGRTTHLPAGWRDEAIRLVETHVLAKTRTPDA